MSDRRILQGLRVNDPVLPVLLLIGSNLMILGTAWQIYDFISGYYPARPVLFVGLANATVAGLVTLWACTSWFHVVPWFCKPLVVPALLMWMVPFRRHRAQRQTALAQGLHYDDVEGRRRRERLRRMYGPG